MRFAKCTILNWTASDSLTAERSCRYQPHTDAFLVTRPYSIHGIAHDVCVRYEHSRVMPATTRCTGIRSAHAETRCPRGDSSVRHTVRGASHTTRLSSPALGLNRGGVRSAYASPHLRTGPSTGRGCLLGLPRRNACSGIVCVRVRRRLHRTPRSPSHAST